MKIYRQYNLTNKTILSLILFSASCLFFSASCFAADFTGSLTTVSITDSGGTNTPPTAVIHYTQTENIIDFDASGSTDDGTITEYRWDFGDGATGSGVAVSHQLDMASSPVTLTVVDNDGGVALAQITVRSPINISVNFQPAVALVPESFKKDTGNTFDDSIGYGWVVSPNGIIVDRDNELSENQAYDTLIRIMDPNAVWEISIPNGNYLVRVCVGDPKYAVGKQFVQVENIPIIEGEALSLPSVLWIEREANIVINDGKLTLTFENSGDLAKLCWVQIMSL